MFGSQNLRTRWMAITARLRQERGVAMVEYTALLACIAFALIFGLTALGGAVGDTLGGSGECQGGGDWSKHHVWAVSGGDKKTALEEDAKGNGDGVVCTKNPTGGGNGNQGNSQNVMDNNK